jgi:hypothetical protein
MLVKATKLVSITLRHVWVMLIVGALAVGLSDYLQAVITVQHFTPQSSATFWERLFSSVVYLNVVTAVGAICFYVCLRFVPGFGNSINPEFKGIKPLPNRSAWNQAALSAFMGVSGSILWTYAVQKYDVGMINVLDIGTIVFIVWWEKLRGKVQLTPLALPIILTLTGVIVSSTESLEALFTWDFPWDAILLVFVGKGVITAVMELSRQSGVQASEPVSFTFWRFVFAAISGCLWAVVATVFTGSYDLYLQIVSKLDISAMILIAVTMLIMLWGQGWGDRARKETNASIVNLVGNSKLVFVQLLSWALAVIAPGLTAAQVPGGMDIALRLLGMLAVSYGVIKLRGYLANSKKAL